MSPESILLLLVQSEEGQQWANSKRGWDLSYTEPGNTEPLCEWDGVLCDPSDGMTLDALFLPEANLYTTLPSELGKLTTLKGLTIPQAHLRGPIPESIAKLPKLEVINLAHNQLTGSIPTFHSKRLRSIDLGNNQLSGTLPQDIGINHDKMTDFDILHNKISGQIPSSFSKMSSLVTLSLSENLFTGTIPSQLGQQNLKSLQFLYLDHNYLIGTIPPSIASSNKDNANAMVEFWLQENMLSGTVPAFIANLQNLKDFYIDGNKFTGEVPTDLCRPDINEDFFKDSKSNSVKNEKDRDYCESIACPTGHVSREGVYPCIACPRKHTNPYLGRVGECIDLNQRDILHHLYQATNGDDWLMATVNNNKNNGDNGIVGEEDWQYNSDKFICDFTGVKCDSNNHIVEIDLKGKGLKGTIPESLGFLRYLRKLDLSDNQLSGLLPSDLRWAPLDYLDISGNFLRGDVPNMLCLTPGINGNGENRVYDCDHIACPIGYYNSDGHAGNGKRCKKCNDPSSSSITTGYLGSKVCHDFAKKGTEAGETFLALLCLLLSCFCLKRMCQYCTRRYIEKIPYEEEDFHDDGILDHELQHYPGTFADDHTVSSNDGSTGSMSSRNSNSTAGSKSSRSKRRKSSIKSGWNKIVGNGNASSSSSRRNSINSRSSPMKSPPSKNSYHQIGTSSEETGSSGHIEITNKKANINNSNKYRVSVKQDSENDNDEVWLDVPNI